MYDLSPLCGDTPSRRPKGRRLPARPSGFLCQPTSKGASASECYLSNLLLAYHPPATTAMRARAPTPASAA